MIAKDFRILSGYLTNTSVPLDAPKPALKSISLAPSFLRLDSVRILQQLRQLATLSLQIRVPANMLMVDEDVRHRALGRHLLEGILDSCAIICPSNQNTALQDHQVSHDVPT